MATNGTLSDAELDREYNVRLLRADFDDIVAGWFARSEAFREPAEAIPPYRSGRRRGLFYSNRRG